MKVFFLRIEDGSLRAAPAHLYTEGAPVIEDVVSWIKRAPGEAVFCHPSSLTRVAALLGLPIEEEDRTAENGLLFSVQYLAPGSDMSQ